MRRPVILLLIPVVLVVGGTLGYYLSEPSYTLFDALYMTVTTLTTVGYGEVNAPIKTRTRVFTVFLLLTGVFTLFYAAGELLRAVISGELGAHLGRQRMERSLAEMNKHTIICGYGRMGRYVCREFAKTKQPFVVIDRRADAVADFNYPHGVAVVGDATSDEVLQRAGVTRATSLVTTAASDADNLYITMSARLLNADLVIVARAENEQAEEKLRRAGATRVVAPYAIGGLKVAQAVLRPNVVDFIELATKTEHLELQIEETVIRAGSQLAGSSLSESRLRQDLGVIIVAIKKQGGGMIYTPPSEARLEAGDTVIALGRRDQLDEFEQRATTKPRS
jgi:voltage-gated potassium channel